MNFDQLAKEYVKKHNSYTAERDKINNRIEQRNQQIKRLKKKLHNLEHPSWIDELVKPIAEAMVKKMPDRYYDILGPFGICSATSIHFYKSGVERSKRLDNCKSITFRPADLENGKITIVDYSQDTGQFRKGTIGEINGMNYPEIPLKRSIVKLLAFMNKQEVA